MAIAIMAFLFAVGVGTYWRMTRGSALRAAVSAIESMLHGARALAVHEHSPAELLVVERQVDAPPALPQVEQIYVLGKTIVSCWHFEAAQLNGSTLAGALGQQGNVMGTAVTVPGRIGRALSLDGSAYVTVKSAYLDGIRNGVFVEAFVWPKSTASNGARLAVASRCDDSGKTIFDLALYCTQVGTGSPVFWLKGSVATTTQALAADTSGNPSIPAGQWTHVALAYDPDATDPLGNPRGIVLLINGQEVDLANPTVGKDPVTASTGSLYIGGDPGHGFVGYLDELTIAALVKGEVQTLPKNTVVTRFGATSLATQGAVATTRAVRFDDEGKLDVTVPSAVARFYVNSPGDNLFRVVQVGRLGRIEVLSKLTLNSPDRANP